MTWSWRAFCCDVEPNTCAGRRRHDQCSAVMAIKTNRTERRVERYVWDVPQWHKNAINPPCTFVTTNCFTVNPPFPRSVQKLTSRYTVLGESRSCAISGVEYIKNGYALFCTAILPGTGFPTHSNRVLYGYAMQTPIQSWKLPRTSSVCPSRPCRTCLTRYEEVIWKNINIPLR